MLLLTIMGLASSFLLLQKPMQSPPAASDDKLNEPRITPAEFAVTALPTAARPAESMDLGAESDSKTAFMNASGTAMGDSADTAPAAVRRITFCVTGLTAKTSSLYVAVFESEAGFPRPESSSRTTVVSATENPVRFSLELPQNHPVAIAVFQDIDGNGKLSKNQIGIPTEPYGFSNNARGLLGPPSFRQAALRISDDDNIADPIEIKVR